MKNKALFIIAFSYLLILTFGSEILLVGWLAQYLIPFFVVFFVPRLGWRKIAILCLFQTAYLTLSFILNTEFLISVANSISLIFGEGVFILNIPNIRVSIYFVILTIFPMLLLDYYFNYEIIKRLKIMERAGIG